MTKYHKLFQRKYLIFLDIDGVLASSRVHCAHNADQTYGLWARLDPVAMDFFNRIHDTHPVEFVVMSTWKNHLAADNNGILHWVQSAFQNSGFRGRLADPWKTDPEEIGMFNRWDRANEVLDYLGKYASDVDDYLLFDDNRYQFEELMPKKRLILTDPNNGLLYKQMQKALSIMGQWDKR